MKPLFTFRVITAMLLLMMFAVSSCKKKNSGPDYTAKMGGVRHWHGIFSKTLVSFPTDSTYVQRDTSWNLNDTSFAVWRIDGSTIDMFGAKLSYQSQQQYGYGGISTDSIYYFEGNYVDVPYVQYFVYRDSIVYSQTINISAVAGQQITVYHTY